MNIVLVQNKTARVLGPSYATKTGGEIVRLLPGINKVSSEDWKKVEKDPLVLHHADSGELVVLDEDADLGNMPVTRAVEIVAGTFDKAALQQWKGADKRKPVQTAIAAQLERLDGSKPDGDEDRPSTIASSPLGVAGAGGVDVSAPRGRR